MKRIVLAVAAMAAVAGCARQNAGRIVASESVIAVSPCPDSIYLFTPGIVEGLDGRFVVAVDYGGPGTYMLDGPKSDLGDYEAGNQIRILISDDKGRHWRETPNRIPMMHEIMFRAGRSLYMVGHSGRLLIARSDDNGETWSEPSVLCPEPRWHQSCTAVDTCGGMVTLVYEKWISDGHPWPGVGPVLMKAPLEADLTDPSVWRFSDLYDPDADMEAARPSGIPVVGVGHAGMLETNVIRIFDPSHPFYDSTGRSVALMARAETGMPDIGVMLKGYEREDDSLAIGRFHRKEGEVYFVHIPGAELKFHVLYDPVTKLYWLLHSQCDGRMHMRRRLALSYSPDLLRWTFAGLVAVGPADNAARHYATMMPDGEDLCIVSRSGDEMAKGPHDGNIVTFHRVRRFRDLVY